MVAYSFKPQFREPILAGTKRQTIRSDRKRHARVGEQLQLYTGMRTRQCRLIGRAVCVDVLPVTLFFANPADPEDSDAVEVCGGQTDDSGDLARFAVADGFPDWPALRRFWSATHGPGTCFAGVMIRWEALT